MARCYANENSPLEVIEAQQVMRGELLTGRQWSVV